MNSDVISITSKNELLDKNVDEVEPSEFHQLYQEFVKNQTQNMTLDIKIDDVSEQ
jgi:hypothetical protein